MSTNQRIRGRALQRIRQQMMRADPLCGECRKQGIVRAWTELDHIQALVQDGKDIHSNRQGLCREHHRQKTLAEFNLKARDKAKIGADGWPIE